MNRLFSLAVGAGIGALMFLSVENIEQLMAGKMIMIVPLAWNVSMAAIGVYAIFGRLVH